MMNNTKTQPIAIINPLQQYTLKHGLFDPIQNSPPSVWKARLTQRLNNTAMPPPPRLIPTIIHLL
jgi:hypothetical protein